MGAHTQANKIPLPAQASETIASPARGKADVRIAIGTLFTVAREGGFAHSASRHPVIGRGARYGR